MRTAPSILPESMPGCLRVIVEATTRHHSLKLLMETWPLRSMITRRLSMLVVMVCTASPLHVACASACGHGGLTIASSTRSPTRYHLIPTGINRNTRLHVLPSMYTYNGRLHAYYQDEHVCLARRCFATPTTRSASTNLVIPSAMR